MATIVVLWRNDSNKSRLTCAVERSTLVNQVKRIERQTFPKTEAMDFNHELKKRNVLLTLAIDESGVTGESPIVLAYALHSRVRSTATLHKMCVTETARRQGIARDLLGRVHSKLASQNCGTVLLWVDVERLPALALYASLEFEVTSHLSDYYGPGRHAVQMKVSVIDISELVFH